MSTNQNDPTPLATYKSIADYVPQFSDFVVRCTWFRSYFGVVNNFDQSGGIVTIVFEGTPRLLFTTHPDEVSSSEILFNIGDIRAQRKGSWSVCQQDHGQPVWYI